MGPSSARPRGLPGQNFSGDLYYERINQVKRYIREHVDEPLQREEMAQISGFSVPHFHRIFRAHMGENITAYVRRVRMERAAHQVLAKVITITEIALDCGYETHSAFRVFAVLDESKPRG